MRINPNNIFIFNKAKWGGAIYLEHCSNIIIERNVFWGNFSIRDGGAISVSQSDNIYILNNFFALNFALRSENKVDVHKSKVFYK